MTGAMVNRLPESVSDLPTALANNATTGAASTGKTKTAAKITTTTTKTKV